MSDQTPEQIARTWLETCATPECDCNPCKLSRAYLALPAPLREHCPAMCVSGIGVDCGVSPDECCEVCGGSGSVLTEDGKRMEEIRRRLYLRMPNTEESEWLLSRLTGALNEIERLKKEALNGKSPLAG